jgi:hypothetical protein
MYHPDLKFIPDPQQAAIEKALDNWLSEWDLESLIDFVFQDRLEYYLESADQDEINSLLTEYK